MAYDSASPYDLLMSIFSAILSKLVDPSDVNLLSSLSAIFVRRKVTHFEPERFASVILKRNKEVFDKLAEM